MIKKFTMKWFAGQLHCPAPVRRGGQICRCGGTPGARGTGKYSTLIKKEKKIFLIYIIYKEIQMGAVAK
jgi:hypothetical protein